MRMFGAAAILVLALTSGCTVREGVTASESGWRSDSDKALKAATSSLGAVDVVLKAQLDGEVPHNVVVVSIDDSIDTLHKEVGTFLTERPPTTRTRADRQIVHVLVQTLATLHSVDVAASGRDRTGWRKALDDTRAGLKDVAAARRDLKGSGR